MRPSAVAGGLLVLSLLAGPLLARGAPLGREDWFDFEFQGHKVGYLFTRDESTSVNDRPALHARRWSVITVRRQEQVIRMESTTDTWSEPDGKPMRYKHVRLEGRETRTSEGYRDGDAFVVRHDVGGNLQERRLPLGERVFLSSAIEGVFFPGLALGKSLSGKAIVEEDGELRDFTIKVIGREKTPSGEAFVVEEQVAGIVSKSLVLADGRTLSVEVPGLGARFRATTREKAIALEAPVDIFSAALFSIEEPLPPGNGLDGLVVRLRGRSGKVPTHIADARQVAKVISKDTVELRIRAETEPSRATRLPITTPSVKVFLKETPYEALGDEVLNATLRRIAGDEKDAWTVARRINGFVYRHIENKSLARAFATANEALETKEGDCTEHAVLFSALAKIAGIPTRLVTGLVYVGGKDNVFGYHEWVEVWIGERWVAMDPTFGQDLADPTHIKFAQGQADPDGLREAGMVAAGLIGDLELDVVELTTDAGETRRLPAR